MFPANKAREAAERFAERREREDAAPRLRDESPMLESLELHIRHEHEGRRCPDSTYVRHISVMTGPALFWVPCSDARCVHGGHDITGAVMRALRAHQTEFEGKDRCMGDVGNVGCQRSLVYSARASYLSRGGDEGAARST